jgi:YD repeat-containing protein
MIEEYEPTGGETITRTFKYGLEEDGAGNIKHDVSLEDYKFSYLCLLSEPYIPYIYSIVDIYCSTPVTNIFYQNGAVVAYEHVTEYIDGKGKTEYEYSSIVNPQYRYPGTTVIEDRKEGDWQEVNLLQKTEYKYDPDSNTYLPARKETNSYSQLHSGYIPYSQAYHKVRKYHANLFYSWLEDIYSPEELMLYVVRAISTGSTHLVEKKIEVFDGERSSIQTITYDYGNSVNHRYLSRQTTSTNGQPVVTSYVYPQDINTAQARGLVENNILTTVLRQEKSVGSKKWITKLQYDYMNNSVIPLPASFSEGPDASNLRTMLEIKKYDAMGNPAYMVDKTKNIVYLWGYGGHKLIAEIQNATYDDIVAALSQARIDRILKGFALSTSDFDALNALRGLPNVSVTTIEYNPAFGISRITDQSGRNTNYNYDSAGRLCRITDDNDNLVEEYEYNYIN